MRHPRILAIDDERTLLRIIRDSLYEIRSQTPKNQ